MDIATTLEIIKMIDKRLLSVTGYSCVDCCDEAVKTSLTELRDHLQSFIEGQLSAAENSTGE